MLSSVRKLPWGLRSTSVENGICKTRWPLASHTEGSTCRGDRRSLQLSPWTSPREPYLRGGRFVHPYDVECWRRRVSNSDRWIVPGNNDLTYLWVFVYNCSLQKYDKAGNFYASSLLRYSWPPTVSLFVGSHTGNGASRSGRGKSTVGDRFRSGHRLLVGPSLLFPNINDSFRSKGLVLLVFNICPAN